MDDACHGWMTRVMDDACHHQPPGHSFTCALDGVVVPLGILGLDQGQVVDSRLGGDAAAQRLHTAAAPASGLHLGTQGEELLAALGDVAASLPEQLLVAARAGHRVTEERDFSLGPLKQTTRTGTRTC